MHTGLTSFEAEKRLRQFGKNIIKTEKKTPLIIQFLEEFKNLMVLILMAAAGISFAANEKKDALIIAFIIVLNATIGFIQKFRAEQAVDALKKMLAHRSRVIRDGKETFISAENLVPGDIIILSEGDRISADAIILEENEFQTQESVLTGESLPIRKISDAKIFMGTIAAYGNAKARIEKTGMETEFGRIAHLTAITEKEKSPLQKELDHISIFIGKITFIIATILVLAGVFIQNKPLLKSILFAVSVAVAAVPEGLPTTITIALALGVQRLAKRKAIMKQLSSVETLGATTVIVSDKTGTLTKNEMEVRKLIFEGHEISLGEEKYLASENETEIITLICCVSTICNNAKNEKENALGDPTEIALLKFAEKIGLSQEILMQKFHRLREFPFDSKRKRMSVIAEQKDSKNRYVLTKGAPDQIISICTHIQENGKIVPLTEEKKQEMMEKNNMMAGSALRVIALAYKKLAPRSEGKTDHEKLQQTEAENEMIFLGLTGMLDPPRPEVQEAIKNAYRAGIKIYIVTGDHGLTAAAIAKMTGIIKEKEEYKIIMGNELQQINDKKLQKLFEKNENDQFAKIIFARVSPEDKLRIVNALKSLNEVVAVTGDGVNDAPALKRADIGISMGIAGTDVSKEAANMVLADDSFATIVNAIEEGRTIYENMKKFLMYIFSSNVGELITIFLALITGLAAPLTAILILLINVGTDILPALALGMDKGEKHIMEKPPRKTDEHILEKNFITRTFFLGILVGISSIGAYLFSLYQNGWTTGSLLEEGSMIHQKAVTVAFVTLVITQMANAYNARSGTASVFKNFFKNFALLGSVALSILFVIAATKIPAIRHAIGITDLEKTEWLIPIAAGLAVICIEEIRKIFIRHKGQKWISQTSRN